MVFMASAPAEHGSLREYMAYDPHFAYPLLPQVSYAEGALTEPLAAAVYGCRKGRVAPGDTVAILGCGPIGLLLAQVARASGASRVLAVDRYPFRLDLARQLGAETLNLEEGDIVGRVLDLTSGQGAEVVLEASGAEQAMCQSLEIARRGGRVVLIGWPQQRTFPFPIQDIGPRELELHGMFRYSNVYPQALAMIAHGQVKLEPLITHRFPFRDMGETFQHVLDNRDSIIKAVIDLELP